MSEAIPRDVHNGLIIATTNGVNLHSWRQDSEVMRQANLSRLTRERGHICRSRLHLYTLAAMAASLGLCTRNFYRLRFLIRAREAPK